MISMLIPNSSKFKFQLLNDEKFQVLVSYNEMSSTTIPSRSQTEEMLIADELTITL